ncbi:hypothetical protein WJX73_009050 [Symbiochloris irregularis]|uniref:MYND-type domain-containing protein n=1 Tax=Symbiochloris irregularis TaxID=706552 RepID=A0AAW1PHV2_9CHLO
MEGSMEEWYASPERAEYVRAGLESGELFDMSLQHPSMRGYKACMEGLCANCNQPGNLKCTKCMTVRYCSRECQKADWKVMHKKTCKTASQWMANTGIPVVPNSKMRKWCRENAAREKAADSQNAQ